LGIILLCGHDGRTHRQVAD